GAREKINIVLAASTNVRFCRTTTPFCCSVRTEDIWRLKKNHDPFQKLYNHFCGQPSATVENVSTAQEPQVRQTSTASTTITDNVPIPTNSSSHATNIPITSQDVDELNPNAMVDGNTNQLRSDDDMCIYALTVSTMELNNVKEAMTDPA
nr:hypothetical protein [Tanacetum cinerariifolium]